MPSDSMFYGPSDLYDGADPAAVVSLSFALLKGAINRRELSWVGVDDAVAIFFVEPEMYEVFLLGAPPVGLQVRGTWLKAVPRELAADVDALCREWAVGRVLPKLYSRLNEEGRVLLVAETSVFLMPGMSPTQCDSFLEQALLVSGQAFEEANARYPQAVERPRELPEISFATG